MKSTTINKGKYECNILHVNFILQHGRHKVQISINFSSGKNAVLARNTKMVLL